MAGGFIGKVIAIVVIIVFAGAMYVITHAIKKKKGMGVNEDLISSEKKEEQANSENKKGFAEKYCNEQKNDSRRALANYILIHEDTERKSRGQE